MKGKGSIHVNQAICTYVRINLMMTPFVYLPLNLPPSPLDNSEEINMYASLPLLSSKIYVV